MSWAKREVRVAARGLPRSQASRRATFKAAAVATCSRWALVRPTSRELRMISIVDELSDGLSSVYTFFDPLVKQASFGTYNILWQVEEARRRGLAYVYLGYWIGQSRKMSYKNQFRPIEGLSRGEWKRLA